MLTLRSQKILFSGTAIQYDNTMNNNKGACYVVKFKGRYYHIIDDGTQESFYNEGKPIQTKENDVRSLLIRRRVPDDILLKNFGWVITEEEKQALGVLNYEFKKEKT